MVRKLIADARFDLSDDAPFSPGKSLGQALLDPTELYVTAVLKAHRQGLIKGAAHITGGGLLENIPRILPEGVAASIDLDRIDPPAVFYWLQKIGHLKVNDMLRTFNCGVGMVLVCQAGDENALSDLLSDDGIFSLGHVIANTGEAVQVTGALKMESEVG